jgi:hypothetical protein
MWHDAVAGLLFAAGFVGMVYWEAGSHSGLFWSLDWLLLTALLAGMIPVDKPAHHPYTRARLPFFHSPHLFPRLADMGGPPMHQAVIDSSGTRCAMPCLPSHARFVMRPELLTRI